MSKSPDLSAFPIPRKGGARPISLDELPEAEPAPAIRAGEGPRSTRTDQPTDRKTTPAKAVPPTKSELAERPRPLPPVMRPAPSTAMSGQVVATTVKLDENRYLRLVNAGQPGPGRLKRRAIQEMVVEAIDEWFDRRGL